MQNKLAQKITELCGFKRSLITIAWTKFLVLWGICALFNTAFAALPVMNKITFEKLPDNKTGIVLHFSSPLVSTDAIRTFDIDTPTPSVVLDLGGIQNGLDKSTLPVELGVATNLQVVQANGRTRVVVNLDQPISKSEYTYKISSDKRLVTLALKNRIARVQENNSAISYAPTRAKSYPFAISGIDFRRSDQNTGKIIVDLSSSNVNVEVQEKGDLIVIDFAKTAVPRRLQRRLDVVDFATPVRNIELIERDGLARMSIYTKGAYQQMAYQIKKKFIVDIRSLNEEEQKELTKKNKQYTGERLSLNFQDIKVRAVLQLIAEFTGLNIVTTDSVQGSITLRLKNVPWDQALDIILKARSLAERREGNVIMIAPADQLAAQEKQELEANKQVQDLTPLQSELLQINYAKAGEVAALLKSKDSTILSERGTVSVDSRTNTLWVQDTAEKLGEVKEFIKHLDIPISQVLIKARIVNVDSTFQNELGVRFGVTNSRLTGTLNGSNDIVSGNVPSGVDVPKRLNFDFPTAMAGNGSIGIALASLGKDTMLDLELSALESEDGGEIVSSPTVITSNQTPALIESGVEIPYQETTSSGASVTSFKKAVLSIQVTPQITPDDRLVLTLEVNQDTEGQITGTVPAINTKHVKTQVLVNNGETIVLGGVYENTVRHTVVRIPFLGSLPVLGRLFRHNFASDKHTELLVFITPKVIKQALAQQN